MNRKKNYGYLLYQFTITDFKLRYSNSVLGYLWSILNPLLMFGVLYFIFSYFKRFSGVEHYPVYLLSGIILWRYFAESTDAGMTSLKLKDSLLNKVSFPRILIPLSSILTNTITLFLNIIVLFIFILFISKVKLTYHVIFSFLILFELILLSFGISVLLSAFYLRFRDLSHLWGVIIQMGFWATPIIYPIDIVPERYHIIFKLNPMARLIFAFRSAIFANETFTLLDSLINVTMVVGVILLGIIIYKKRQRLFAEWL